MKEEIKLIMNFMDIKIVYDDDQDIWKIENCPGLERVAFDGKKLALECFLEYQKYSTDVRWIFPVYNSLQTKHLAFDVDTNYKVIAHVVRGEAEPIYALVIQALNNMKTGGFKVFYDGQFIHYAPSVKSLKMFLDKTPIEDTPRMEIVQLSY
jgi:hypothetical protein